MFKEHAGETEDESLMDPLSEKFAEVWEKRAKINTKKYRKVFRCYPDNQITQIREI